MNKKVCSLIFTCSTLSTFSFACDPLSLDWKKFHKTYDLNKNDNFELNEFLKVKDFNPLPWPDDRRFKGQDKNTKLFKFLDENKDGKLSDEEVGEIHSLFPDPCANWPQ